MSSDDTDHEDEWEGLVESLVNDQAVSGVSLLGVLRLLAEKKVLIDPEAKLIPHASVGPSASPLDHERRAEATRRPAELSAEELMELIERAPAAPLVPPLDQIAAVICETYAEAGDDAVLPDDEALLMIRDILLDDDQGIIERNRGKNVAAWARSWDRLLPRDSQS